MATMNASVVTLSRAWWIVGVVDGVQVNSILPETLLTERRGTFLEKWAQMRGMTFEKAMRAFPWRVWIWEAEGDS